MRTRFQQTTLLQRIAAGNILVIIAGAIAGTLTTRFLLHWTSDWILIVFLLVGISISTLINLFIVNAALRPVGDLGRLVKRLQSKSTQQLTLPLPDFRNADPYTSRMAATLQSLFQHLEERNEELRALSERAISAQEIERKAIAQSLHDDTGQALTMLAIHLDRIDEGIPDEQQELKKRVAEARMLTSNALTELRCIVSGLRPSILDDLGLVSAIRWYARTNLETAGIQVNFRTPNTAFDLPSPVATTLFRIAQEAMNNIVRHSRADQANIWLQVDETQVQLSVEDNGLGFDQPQIAHNAVHANQLGLVGIRERVQLLGGELTIESEQGKGSRLLAVIPLNHAGGDHGG